nr:hypothetical protein [Acidimicrobiia bacterium]
RTRRASTAVDTTAVLRVGTTAGLDAVGVAAAEGWSDARITMEGRVAAGLVDTMRFTYGHPERSTDPRTALPGATAVVVGALGYRRPAEPSVPAASPGDPAGRVATYVWDDSYGELRVALRAVADHLLAGGWRARVLVDDNALVDRVAAHRAGLGWFGKNANLLLPGRGSWFVLGGVVTDAPLLAAPAPPPASSSGGSDPVATGVPGGRVGERSCGACRRCLDGCPTGAIVAPGVVDAGRCLSWLLQRHGPFPRQYREVLGDRIYGCDDCQEVCPPNRRADAAMNGAQPTRGAGAVDLLDLLAAGDADLLARHGRWYVPRRDPDHLRRNALLVLGNVGDATDSRVVAAVDRYLAHPSPVLREQAAWTARRLGLVALVTAHADDPVVAAELAAPAPAPGAGG